MGVNFVIIVENLNKKTQEEINKQFPPLFKHDNFPEWENITYKGKEYARWLFPPRFFLREENPKQWEALRKYLIKVSKFVDSGEVLLTNDACWWGFFEEDNGDETGYDFYLPGRIRKDEMEDPDYEKHPELKNIKELEGLTW